MTVCCYVFRKSKPIKFKASGNETLKAYRLEFSHNSNRENWGDHWSATDWQKKESRKLKRLRANSYPLKRHQFFVIYHKDSTELDLWSAGPGATKAWDDHDVVPGTWCGRLVKKQSGRGWDYHSRGMVELRVKDLIRQAFLFIGRNPDMHVEESCSTYYDRLLQAQREDHDWDPCTDDYIMKPWDRLAQMRTQQNKIYDLGFNLFEREKLEQQQERKAL